MDPVAIMGSVKTAIDLARTVKDVAADTELKIKTSDLYDSIISLQNVIFSLQSENQSLLNSKYELEKKLVEFERWEKEKTSQTYLKFASTLNHVAYCFVASAYASVQGFSVQSSGGHLRSDSGKCFSSDFSSPLSMRMHSL